MRNLIRQLNEAAGRKYYVLVGWNAKMKRWEVIFSDYDRKAVEFEQQDYKGGPNYGEEYKPIRIVTVDNARRGTVDAAVAALDAPGGNGEAVESGEAIEEAKKDRPKAHGRMAEYDWEKVAAAFGGKLIPAGDSRERAIRVHLYTYRFWDNGGEINITKESPVGDSVPFWSNAHPGGSVGPITLAYRLNAMIDGEPIDYEKDLDTPSAKTEAISDPWAKAAAMLQSGEVVLKLLDRDLDKVREGMRRAAESQRNLQKVGAGATEALDLLATHVLAPLRTLANDVEKLVGEVERTVNVRRNA